MESSLEAVESEQEEMELAYLLDGNRNLQKSNRPSCIALQRRGSAGNVPLPMRGIRLACGAILVMGILLTVLSEVDGGVINAKSVSLADVSSAIASAHDGDTVTVPTGTASWISTLTITKGINLVGGGNDTTVVLDDVPQEERRKRPPERGQRQGPRQQQLQSPRHAPRLARSMPGPGAASPRGGSNSGIMNIQLTSGQTFRLTGFTFRYGFRTVKPQNPGAVKIGGTCFSVRVDHCHFDQLYQAGLSLHGWLYGVVDHCRWDARTGAGPIGGIRCYNGATWGGGSNDYGDGSWAAPTNFGSAKFMFIEDNIFNNTGTIQTNPSIDSHYGSRYVCRHNQFLNCTMVTGHGTESGGRLRGQRALEFYNNTATLTIPESVGITRSGVTIYHHNTWRGPLTRPVIPLTVFREDFPFPMFGGADGTDPWDVNDTEGNGTNVPGHSPHLYASGTHTGANASATLISAGAGWKPNQWVGYMLTNTTQTTRAGKHPNSRILSNTGDTMVYSNETPDSGKKTFNTGDGFIVYKLLIALDQPGRGMCDLLAQNPPLNTVTGGKDWPHQALEPIYAWNNTLNGSIAVQAGSRYPTLQENHDFYNYTASFDGTVGVGAGTLENRPKTCTPGVAYWATDQGEWDSTHDGPDGQLYICKTANSWTLYYKPYSYPHPLVSQTVSSPAVGGPTPVGH